MRSKSTLFREKVFFLKMLEADAFSDLGGKHTVRTHTEDASKPRREEQELLQVDGE